MKFDEDLAYNKSKKRPPEETEEPIIHDTTMTEEIQEEDQDFEEAQEPVLGLGPTRVLYYYLCTNKNTHSVGPFGNNLRTGCSLTRNSYGVPQN